MPENNHAVKRTKKEYQVSKRQNKKLLGLMAGMTQGELAERSLVSRNKINGLCQFEESKPSIIKLVSDALNATPAEIGYPDNKPEDEAQQEEA